MKTKVSYGCKECGKYVTVEIDTGLWSIGTFNDNDIPEKINKICSCPKNKKKGR